MNVKHLMAKLFAMASLVFFMCGAEVAKADTTLPDGYFFMSRTNNASYSIGWWSDKGDSGKRLIEAEYSQPTTLKATDLPYLFKVTKNTETGAYKIVSVAANKQLSFIRGMGAGEGIGMSDMDCEWAITYDQSKSGYTVQSKNITDWVERNNYWMMCWSDKAVSSVAPSNLNGNRFWKFTQVNISDDEVAALQRVPLSMPSGYYYVKTSATNTLANAYMYYQEDNAKPALTSKNAEVAATPTANEKGYIFELTNLGEGKFSLRNCLADVYVGGQLESAPAHHGYWSEDAVELELFHYTSYKVGEVEDNDSYIMNVSNLAYENVYGNTIRPGGGSEASFLWYCTPQGEENQHWNFTKLDLTSAQVEDILCGVPVYEYKGDKIEDGYYFLKANDASDKNGTFAQFQRINREGTLYPYVAHGAKNIETPAEAPSEDLYSYIFKIEMSKDNKGYTLKNIKSGLYVGLDNGAPAACLWHVAMSETPCYFELTYDESKGGYKIFDTYTQGNPFTSWLATGSEQFLWYAKNNGSYWKLIKTDPMVVTEMSDGYYYMVRTNCATSALSWDAAKGKNGLRLIEEPYTIKATPEASDLPYIFKLTRNQDTGFYTIYNMSADKKLSFVRGMGEGEGVGMSDMDCEWEVVYDKTKSGFTVRSKSITDWTERNDYWLMSWGDKAASSVAPSNLNGNRFWKFVKVETEAVDAIIGIAKAQQEFDANVALAAQYLEGPVAGDKVGNVKSQEIISALKKVYTKQRVADRNSYDKMVAANTALKAAIDDFVANIILPEEGKVYNIITGSTRTYALGQPIYVKEKGGMMNLGNYDLSLNNMNADKAAMWMFEKIESNETELPVYAVKNIATGQYMGAYKGQGFENVPVMQDEAVPYYIYYDRNGNFRMRQVGVEDTNDCLKADQTHKVVLNYPSKNDKEFQLDWTIQETTTPEMAEGYYFISPASAENEALCYDEAAQENWRMYHKDYTQPTKLSMEDKPYIFRVVKYNGGFAVMNYANKQFIGRDASKTLGEGLSWVADSVALTISYNKDNFSWNMLNENETLSNGNGIAIEEKNCVGYWNDATSMTTAYTFNRISDEDIEYLESTNALAAGYYKMVTARNDNKIYTDRVAYYDQLASNSWRLKFGAVKNNKEAAFAPAIFKFDKVEGGYTIKNVVADKYVGRVAGKGEGEGLGFVDEATTFNVILADKKSGYWYIQSQDATLKNGRAINAPTTTWSTNDGYLGYWGETNASNRWYLVPLTEEEFTQEMNADSLGFLLNKASYLLTQTGALKKSEGLITDAAEAAPKGQVVSSFQTADYSSYKNLIDGDLGTCMQSSWDGKYTGKQYMTVDLRENPVKDFSFTFGLRGNTWGWVEMWSDVSIYATNDSTLALGTAQNFDASQWTKVSDFQHAPNYKFTNGEWRTDGGDRSYDVDVIGGLSDSYRYIRFQVNSTLLPQNCNMYTVGEFQVYAMNEDFASVGVKSAPLAADLKNAMVAAATVAKTGKATTSDIDALNKAIDAYVAMPNDAKDLLAEAKDTLAKISDAEGNILNDDLKNDGEIVKNFVESLEKIGNVDMYDTLKEAALPELKREMAVTRQTADSLIAVLADAKAYIERGFSYQAKKLEDADAPIVIADAKMLDSLQTNANTLKNKYLVGLKTIDAAWAAINEIEKLKGWPEEGYYIIYNTNSQQKNYDNRFIYYDAQDGANWRMKYGSRKFNTEDTDNYNYAPGIFKLTKGADFTYVLKNVMADQFVGRVAGQGAGEGMGLVDEQPAYGFDFKKNANGTWAIQYQDETLAHGHGLCAQSDSYIGCWGDNNNNNQWFIAPVTGDVEAMINTFNLSQVASEAYDLMKSFQDVTVTDNLITEVDDTTPANGQAWGSYQKDTYSFYKHLIDGNTATCFQSSWSIGRDKQFLTVDLRENPVQDFNFKFGLRDGSWGYKEMWSDVTIYATNDGAVAAQTINDFNATQWVNLGKYTSNFPAYKFTNKEWKQDGSKRSFSYNVVGAAQEEYRYVRFQIGSTILPQNNGMYTIGEFNLRGSEYAEEPYYEDLANAVKDAFQKVQDENATQQDIDNLKKLMEDVESREVSVTDINLYSTLCSARNLDFSNVEGLDAYIVVNHDSKFAYLQKVEKVPAFTGLLIVNNTGKAVEVPLCTEETDDVSANLLKGTVKKTLLAGDKVANNYLLNNDILYPLYEDYEIPAWKAYLPLQGENFYTSGFGLKLPETDKVNAAKVNIESGKIYNLNGVEVQKPVKGQIYIINGKTLKY